MGSDETDTFTVEHYDETGNCVRYTTLIPTHYPITDRTVPHPKYEICTPASQNYMPATTLYDKMAAFIPYADDPAFPMWDYLEGFDEFSWQSDFDDPDLEVIQLETVRRLHFYHDFSYEEIDVLKIFPPLRISPAQGLLWSVAQRDIPWRGLADYIDKTPAPILPKNLVLNTPDLFTAINQDLPDFCPNLNCLRTFCPTHRNHKYPPIDPVKPKITSTDLKSSKGKACSEECFRFIDEDDFPDLPFWENEDDVKTLESVLKLMPDQNPCDLAIICRKPCREVFGYRCKLMPDECIVDELYREERPSRFVMPQFVDLLDDENNGSVETPTFAPLYPCHHKGPCDQNSTCPCYMAGQHCQRNCRCTVKCPIRWKGCDCVPSISGISCKYQEDSDCICRQMNRECDPEVCTGCDARGKTKRRPPCRNVDLQRGITKNYIAIDRGSYGLGAFATTNIKADVVIGEYVAEIFSAHYVSHREIINDYTGLNYGFDLNLTTNLDSAGLGNNTRYLNDARPHGEQGEQDNNCGARIRLVNGDHRIAIITLKPVEIREELLLDYGPKYWTHPEDQD
ncbi:hypothetical protein BDZ94DRAFT_1266409 [Collybia nuda]|uniref:SET domain-containing protein n=1 Tax=Collybia nuda TaxID=64659 RepID=A0A9P6CC50_9AGAR|nr:hypothetical protein BDZ94DRAFT_1266409 [Collybia nuda]